jgi:hypothetical protein
MRRAITVSAALITLFAPIDMAQASHGLDNAIHDIREGLDDLDHLRGSGQVRFADDQAAARYQRAMHHLAEALEVLEGMAGGGGGAPTNYRGQAVVLIRQHVHSMYASEAIAKLPTFVSQDDLAFIEQVARSVHSTYVAGAIGAFFSQAAVPDPRNRRGQAGKILAERVHSMYLTAALRKLPGFVSDDDLAFVQKAAQSVSSIYLEGSLGAYFDQPSSPDPRNRRGAVGQLIVERVHSIYLVDALLVLPGFIDEHDLPNLRQLIQSTHSMNVVQALREYFGQ